MECIVIGSYTVFIPYGGNLTATYVALPGASTALQEEEEEYVLRY